MHATRIFTRPAHVSAGAPVGAGWRGWRVSESVPSDSKVVELNTRRGIKAKILSKQFISSGLISLRSKFSSNWGQLRATRTRLRVATGFDQPPATATPVTRGITNGSLIFLTGSFGRSPRWVPASAHTLARSDLAAPAVVVSYPH